MKYTKEFYINVTPTGFNAVIYIIHWVVIPPCGTTKMSSLRDLHTANDEKPYVLPTQFEKEPLFLLLLF
ncbi:MAG: hypothetical protein PF692_13090 [Kiritimatiellae bacterium]|jgi:hypothetical protein|nr:hypothetical protein [Kiritimatiellia bacterium]